MVYLMMSSRCIFCSVVRKTSPSAIVYEDSNMIVIMDIKPITPGHMLVVPKEHQELITELDDQLVGKMLIVAKKMGLALKASKLGCRGVSYLLSDGSAAGQEIYHTHLHIIPRYSNDGFYLHFPEGREEETTLEDLNRTATKLRAKLED